MRVLVDNERGAVRHAAETAAGRSTRVLGDLAKLRLAVLGDVLHGLECGFVGEHLAAHQDANCHADAAV
jgi:hypothetical protein